MVTEEQIKAIKQLLMQLEIDYYEYTSDNENYDYEDLKKRIFDIQEQIKAITEYWEY